MVALKRRFSTGSRIDSSSRPLILASMFSLTDERFTIFEIW